MRYEIVIALSTVLAGASLAGHGVARDRLEKATDRAELRQDHRQALDDLQDLRSLETLARRLDAARANDDLVELRRIDVALDRAVRVELKESQRETREDEAELRRARREVRSSRRERRDNRRADAPRRVKVDDRRDLRDDRRDRKDDRADLQRERAVAERRRQIALELDTLQGNHDATSMQRKSALVDALIVMARTEARENAAEAGEDRRELREDRRELREDRRQGG